MRNALHVFQNNGNAYAANEKLEGKKVAVEGEILLIDNEGNYIKLSSVDSSLNFITIKTDNEIAKKQLLDVIVGDVVTIKGTITGEDDYFSPYVIEADKISKK